VDVQWLKEKWSSHNEMDEEGSEIYQPCIL
jgi:hypothetical protein